MHLVVQSPSCVWLFATPCTAAHQASMSFNISQSLLRLMSIESVMLFNHLILCHPLLLPPVFPSFMVFFQWVSSLYQRWEYWSFSFSISPSNESLGLIYFRIDWSDLLSVQWTLKSLLQHHNSKALIPLCSAFFMVQLSHQYMTTTGKTIALTRQTFVDKMMSLLFNTLSRFVTAFLSKSRHLLILWLQSPSTVILEPKKIKSVTASTFSHWSMHLILSINHI